MDKKVVRFLLKGRISFLTNYYEQINRAESNMGNKMVYHIDSSQYGILVKLQSGNFIKMKKETNIPLCDILTGYSYIVVSKSFQEVLLGLGISGIRFVDIHFQGDDVAYMNEKFVEMCVENNIQSSDIDYVSPDGDSFYFMDNEYLFVTPSLKQKLEQTKFNFEFSYGLTEFG